MSNSPHRPAAAWSRDSLVSWDYMKTDCMRKPGTAGDPAHAHYSFLCRWAIKILTLVHEEMGFCDWYWFLDRHFNKELMELHKLHEKLMWFRDPNTGETDPMTEGAQ